MLLFVGSSSKEEKERVPLSGNAISCVDRL